MGDRRLSPRYFDQTKTLVATRYGPVAGTYLKPGEELPADLDYRTRLSMWMSRRAVYQDAYTPTPHAEGEGEPDNAWMNLDRGVFVIGGENGWYEIKPEGATDETEGEKVHGIEAAQERAEDLRQAHENKGVTIEGGAGGWYSVTAPWLAEPIRVQGEGKAAAERDRLALEGPPEGWSPTGEAAPQDGGQQPPAPAQVAQTADGGQDPANGQVDTSATGTDQDHDKSEGAAEGEGEPDGETGGEQQDGGEPADA